MLGCILRPNCSAKWRLFAAVIRFATWRPLAVQQTTPEEYVHRVIFDDWEKWSDFFSDRFRKNHHDHQVWHFLIKCREAEEKIPIRGRTKNQIYAETLKRPSLEQIYATSSGSWEENCKNVLHKTDGWSPIGHTAERMKRSLAVQSLRLAWVQTLSSVGWWYHKVVGRNLTSDVKFNSITLVS